MLLLGRREHGLEVQLAHAGVQQGAAQFGMVVADDLAQPREEGVALAQMAHAAPIPVAERFVRIARGWRPVALQQRHAPTGRAESQGGAQPGHPGPDHQHVLVRRPRPNHDGRAHTSLAKLGSRNGSPALMRS